LFNVDWADWVVGVVLLAISLFLLIGCLITLTKILSSLFKGPTGKLLTKWVNSDLPGFGKYFTGFIAILVIYLVFYFYNLSTLKIFMLIYLKYF